MLEATNSRFCMQVDLDRPQPSLEKKNGRQKQNGRQKTKWPPKTKLSITQSIFKLEAPDFAWQFILTLRKNGRQKTKWPPKIKLSITHSFLKLQARDFACK